VSNCLAIASAASISRGEMPRSATLPASTTAVEVDAAAGCGAVTPIARLSCALTALPPGAPASASYALAAAGALLVAGAAAGEPIVALGTGALVAAAEGYAMTAAPFWKYAAPGPALGTAITAAPFVKYCLAAWSMSAWLGGVPAAASRAMYAASK